MGRDRALGKHFIRKWRQYRGYSLRKLAAMMEREPGVELVTFATLGRIETGMLPYNEEILGALAIALDCDVADLLTVDPSKDGKVVDLVRMIDDSNRAAAVRVLQAFTGTGGMPVLMPQDEDDADLADVGDLNKGAAQPRISRR